MVRKTKTSSSIRFLAVSFIAACGCGGISTRHSPPQTRADTDTDAQPEVSIAPDVGEKTVVELDGIAIDSVVTARGEVKLVATHARELFDSGTRHLSTGRFAASLHAFSQLLADFPTSRLVPPSLYNAGLALEGLGRPEQAIARYLALARRRDAGRDAVDGHMRAVAVMAELGRHREAANQLDAILRRADLSDRDRIEGLARLGFVWLEQKQYPLAEETLNKGLEIARQSGSTSGYFVGMTHYYLGEVARRQFAAIPVRMPESQLTRDIENKAGLVNLATERYSEAVRTGSIYWGAAAGYRLASMQYEFWRAVVAAPAPAYLSRRAASRYALKVHKHARGMLEKALRIHRQNVELAGAYRVSTLWSEASRGRVATLIRLLARESRGERVVPPPTVQRPAAAISSGYVPRRFEL